MQKTDPRIQEAIDSLTPDLIPAVKAIESGVKTTQGNYGPYMSLISNLVPESSKVTLFVVAHALIAAGADRRGVASALRIITG